MSGMVDGWCGNNEGVGNIGGIWWMDKGEDLVCNVDINGRNIWI